MDTEEFFFHPSGLLTKPWEFQQVVCPILQLAQTGPILCFVIIVVLALSLCLFVSLSLCIYHTQWNHCLPFMVKSTVCVSLFSEKYFSLPFQIHSSGNWKFTFRLNCKACQAPNSSGIVIQKLLVYSLIYRVCRSNHGPWDKFLSKAKKSAGRIAWKVFPEEIIW